MAVKSEWQYKDRVPYFSNLALKNFYSNATKYGIFVVHRHPVILVADSTNPDNLIIDLFIPNSKIINKSLVLRLYD